MSTSVQAPDLSLFPATFDASTMNDARACPVPAIADRSSPSLPSRYGPGCTLPDWMTELFHACLRRSAFMAGRVPATARDCTGSVGLIASLTVRVGRPCWSVWCWSLLLIVDAGPRQAAAAAFWKLLTASPVLPLPDCRCASLRRFWSLTLGRCATAGLGACDPLRLLALDGRKRVCPDDTIRAMPVR